MDDPRETDPLERLTGEDEARKQFEKAAEVARRAHADPRPDHMAEPSDDEEPGREPGGAP